MLRVCSEYAQNTSEMLKARAQYLMRLGYATWAHPAQDGSGHPEHPQPFADALREEKKRRRFVYKD